MCSIRLETNGKGSLLQENVPDVERIIMQNQGGKKFGVVCDRNVYIILNVF